MDFGVKHPSWPRLALRRKRRAVIDDVIDSAKEEFVHRLLNLAEGRERMLVEPCRRFGGSEWLARDVRRRSGELHTRNLLSLGFGNIARGVEVQDVGRRTVRLVAND